MVSPESLRFDFSHFQKVTAEQLREVERLVNRAVRANDPLVENREATQEEAKAAGAMMLFGEKYGDKVRMVRFGESVELCGGTHTSATGNIGFVKIVSESAISAGVRRIEAVTGEKAENMLYAAEDTIHAASEAVGNPKLVDAVRRLVESNESLTKELEAVRKEQVAALAESMAASAVESNGVTVIAQQMSRPTEFLKDLAYNLRSRIGNLALVLGSAEGGKATLMIMLGDAVVAKGVDAGAVVREAAKLMNGGGGGQKFFATAGGKNPDGLQAAIDKAVALINEKL
jgi:alanyl-tRNA synthetase